MRQVLRPGALERPSGIGWRGRWEGGSGWGIHVTPWLIRVNVWQNPLKCCEIISLQLIKINEKKKLHGTYCPLLFGGKSLTVMALNWRRLQNGTSTKSLGSWGSPVFLSAKLPLDSFIFIPLFIPLFSCLEPMFLICNITCSQKW